MSDSAQKEASPEKAPVAPPSSSQKRQDNDSNGIDKTKEVEANQKENEKDVDEEDDGSDSEPGDDDQDEKQATPSSSEAGTSSNAASRATSTPAPGQHPTAGAWQAIWSPQYNAYYFYNAESQETTWSNPMQTTLSSSGSDPAEAGPSTSTPAPALSSHQAALEAAAVAQGIDPSLAYLDPTLAHSVGASAGTPSPALGLSFTAKFNARTGQFTRPDGRDPSHLSEYERMKRMSDFYFDVNAWEKEVAQRNAEEAEDDAAGGKKRKRPSKKDLERFKEQKRLKKIAKTAWLRT